MRSDKRDSVSESTAALGNEYDYDLVLEKIGFGKTQWMVLLISGLLTITSMGTQFSMGIMAIASQCEFQMSQSDKGLFMASCVTGIFLSTYFWGYVSDAYGRRSVLLYSTLVGNLLQFITLFVVNIWLFNIINLLIGISLGGISASVYAYLSEFNTAKYRAIVINYSTTFVSVASIYVPVIAWWVLSSNWSVSVIENFYAFRPWRLIIVFNFLPGLIASFLLSRFPESPKFLLAQSKEDEALAAVNFISKYNTGKSVENVLKVDNFKLRPEALDDDNVLLSKRGACSILLNIWQATVPLFQKPHGVHFILSVIAFFGMFFSSSGLQIWYPEIVNRSSADDTDSAATVCEILDASFAKQMLNQTTLINEQCDDSISTKTYIDNIILGFAFLIGFSTQGLLLNPLGRKNVLLGTLIIAVICGISLHFVSNSTALLVLFCLYILMPNLSISIMCGAVVDFLPTHLRGKGVAISLTLGRLGIVFAANLIGVMLEPFCNATFAVFTSAMLICTIIVSMLPI